MGSFLRGVPAWLRHLRFVFRKNYPDCQVTIEVRQWLPFIVTAGLLFWYVTAPSITVALCLGASASLLAFGYVWARQMASRLRGKRTLRYSAMQVGDELEELVSLNNTSLLPAIWVEVFDQSSLPAYTMSGARGVGGLGNMAWRAHTICTQRGLFRLGPWELRTGDPLGFFYVRIVTFDAQEVLVYPPLAALQDEWFPHKGSPGESRPLRQPINAETIDGMSVREFTYGDSLRHVHWPTTARMDCLYVKVFEPHAASRFWILPDLDPDCQLGSGAQSTEETAILLAASLAAKFLDERLQVGLFAPGVEPVAVMPQHGQAHLWNLLSALAPLHPQAGYDLERGLAQLQPLISQRDSLIIITPAVEGRWLRNLTNLIRARGRPTARVFLLDPLSFGGQISAERFRPVLAEAGVETNVVQQGVLQPILGTYGALSRWEFVTSGTGRAVARQAPRQAASIFAGQKAR